MITGLLEEGGSTTWMREGPLWVEVNSRTWLLNWVKRSIKCVAEWCKAICIHTVRVYWKREREVRRRLTVKAHSHVGLGTKSLANLMHRKEDCRQNENGREYEMACRPRHISMDRAAAVVEEERKAKTNFLKSSFGGWQLNWFCLFSVWASQRQVWFGGRGSIFRLMRASVNSKNKSMFQCRHNAVTRMADDTTHMESIFKVNL